MRGEARLGWALAAPALVVIAAGRAVSARLDGLGVAAPARPAHAVAGPAVRRARQLRRSAGRRALLERARRTPRSCRGRQREPRAVPGWCSRWCCTAFARARARPHGRAPAVGDADRGGGADLALHVRARGWPTRWSRRSASTAPPWFTDPLAAWLPIMLADVWKTTPFVALLLLAGLQAIDRVALRSRAHRRRRAAGGSSSRSRCRCSAPALLVALLFRALDALRVFDLIYVLTGGGPGTATEPLALYTFVALLQQPALRLRLGAVRDRCSRSAFGWRSRSCACSAATASGASARHERSRGRIALVAALVRGQRPVSAVLGAHRVAHARAPAVRGAVARAARAGPRPLSRAVRRARLLDADPQLAGGRRRAPRSSASRWARPAPTRWRGCASAAGAAAGVRARGLDVPADLDRAAAVPGAARAGPDRHLPGPGPALPHLRHAADGLAAGRLLPAAAAELEEAARVDGAAGCARCARSSCPWRGPAWRRRRS